MYTMMIIFSTSAWHILQNIVHTQQTFEHLGAMILSQPQFFWLSFHRNAVLKILKA
jgi:hypothetical protein